MDRNQFSADTRPDHDAEHDPHDLDSLGFEVITEDADQGLRRGGVLARTLAGRFRAAVRSLRQNTKGKG